LKGEEQEEYRHRFPPGRLQEAPQLVGCAAMFASPLLAQFNFVLLHDRGKLRLGYGHLVLRRFILVKPTSFEQPLETQILNSLKAEGNLNISGDPRGLISVFLFRDNAGNFRA